MVIIPEVIKIAKATALEAGKLIMEIYNSGNFSIETKGSGFPVTIADTTANRTIKQHLNVTGFPVLSEEDSTIDYLKRKSWEYFWLIDPLDGTKEFINRNGEFTINIALIKHQTPVAGVIYAPVSNKLYAGSKETGVYKIENNKEVLLLPLAKRKTFSGLAACESLRVVASRSHMSPETKVFIDRFKNVTLKTMGSALKFMLLLEDEADIYPRFGTTMEWDTAAAHAILNASNRGIYQTDLSSELTYNKTDLRNPTFIAF